MRSSFFAILDDGGWVLYALFAVCFLMWWVAALRFDVVRRRSTDGGLTHDSTRALSDGDVAVHFYNSANDVVSLDLANPWPKIDALGADATKRFGAWRALLKSMVAAAPMLGLLGTVGGMVETFATLHVSGLAHADESVAGGISTALLTTQLGLLVGVPGLIVANSLDRLESRRVQELTEIRQRIALRVLATPEAR